MAYPHPTVPTAHPEAPPTPDGVAFAPVPLYRHPPQQQSPVPTPPAAPPVKAIVAGVGVMALLTVGVGFRVYEAGIAHGQSGSKARIAQLETQTTATKTNIKTFCEANQ